MESIENVKFYPDTGRKRLEAFVRGRSEWCISRQRAWGVPLPILYHNDEPLLNESSIENVINVLEKEGIDSWWEKSPDHFLSKDTLEGKYCY